MNIENYCYKIKHQLNIIHFIIKCNTYENENQLYYNALYNPYMCLLIIQEMCIGIFIPIHIAKHKYAYLNMILERKEYTTLNQKTSCKIITINDNWDISKWSYCKLIKYDNWMNNYVEDNTLEEIKTLIQDDDWKTQYIDLPFLEAMCFN